MALDHVYKLTNKDPQYDPHDRKWVSQAFWTSTWLAQMSVHQPGVVVDPVTLESSRLCPPELVSNKQGRVRMARFEPGHNARKDTQHLLADPLYADMLGGNMKQPVKRCSKCGGEGHNRARCRSAGISRQLQQSKKQMLHLANSKVVDLQSPSVLDLTSDKDDLGPIVRPDPIDLPPPPSATRPMGFSNDFRPNLLQPRTMESDLPSDSLIGMKVFKDFGHSKTGEYYGAFNGTVVLFNKTGPYYSIEWSDGDKEDMNRHVQSPTNNQLPHVLY